MKLPGDKTLASARTHSFQTSPPPSPLPPPSLPSTLPCGRSLLSTRTGCVCADARKKIKKLFFFLEVLASMKREKKNSVFNTQDPQDPCAPRASRAKPREEKGFFGLVPLVTHPSSIPLLGGLTPKFLSLSLHSL
jgi:hypothetical protein